MLRSTNNKLLMFKSVEEAVGEGDKAKEEELLRQLTSIPVVQKLLRDDYRDWETLPRNLPGSGG